MSIISRARPGQSTESSPEQPTGTRRGPVRRALGVLCTVLAATLVYLALALPDSILHPSQGAHVATAFLRLPIEALLGGALIIAVPRRWRRPTGLVLGATLGVLTVL